MRELRVLQETRHPNIVRLLKVVTGSKPDSVFLVFEFCQHDMGRLLDTMPRPFTHQEVKSLMKQLLAAVDHCHQRWVMHRDIKMSNLLYTNTGHLKLCDLGLARYFQPFPAVMTPRVVTLWYRAPEVLLGAEVYDEAVDVWSVGCVFGELLRHAPLFPAKTELECLKMHCELLGTPTPSIWKGIEELPHYKTLRLPEQPYNYVKQKLGNAAGGSQAALDLLNRMLMSARTLYFPPTCPPSPATTKGITKSHLCINISPRNPRCSSIANTMMVANTHTATTAILTLSLTSAHMLDPNKACVTSTMQSVFDKQTKIGVLGMLLAAEVES
ncbi:kinase-like domain-containing protein [Dunaliella salina]|uniref:Kinase-like domain-containing protein n=1 Tax=Dunaliella salina TaxID=3046 RepID=A0ABQ7H9A9_DUNSA|nr:kinase-like domain-containing protein [Dunaliella salina]KAF5843439.1 kinase-like domain-containing protein [Dunaliella salina]|eukprot:KAF5843438.1 kinase-like domain-containing protein [Dunaliella salina]